MQTQAARRQTSRQRGTRTSLHYNRARYYDPGTGRFLSEDPLEFYGGGANFYRYTFNNSTNLNDPSGLAPSLVDRLLDWLKPTHAPPTPCAPKFNCDPDGYRDADPFERARVLAEARAFNGGTPYVYGGKTPDGFDCSGFVCWVVRHAANPNFPTQGTGTMGDNQIGLAPIDPSLAGGGDIVLLPGHVGFYGPDNGTDNLLSSRGDPNDPENSAGVAWAPIRGWHRPARYFRLRVPCYR